MNKKDNINSKKKLNAERVNDEQRIKYLQQTIKDMKNKKQFYEKIVADIESLESDKTKLQNDIRACGTNLNSNIERVEAVLNSLIKALMSRKKLST